MTLRRLLHAATAGVLVLRVVWPWPVVRWILVASAGAALLVDVARLSHPALGAWLATRLPVFRPSESRRLSGAAWLAVGYALAAWLPPPAPAAGILTAAVADPAAAWIGGRYGGGAAKSWAGSGAAWIAGVAVLLALGWSWRVALGGGLVGAALERWSVRWDDNLTMAPGVGMAVLLLA